ncbi:MAG: DUF992 domain-containing protein [Methylovirgula sp.]|nr:DUF992 domain-containing protein [Methylovirgula sp.]
MGFQPRVFAAALVALCAPWFASAGTAQAAQVGLLECNVAPSVGLIITSRKALSCRFSRSYAPPDYYVGTITHFGLALGATGPGRIVWGVFAATRELGHTALAGSYGGATANVSLGLGLGANALVGGNAYSIGLQPLSVNTQTGVDITAGITGLQLEPAPGPWHYHRHPHPHS